MLMAQTAGTVDSDWILAQLAQPVPMQTEFVELRSSRLLKKPLRVAGQYRRPDSNTLVREVRSPYAETTTIGNGEVRIVRGNARARVFPLSRVPQLAGMEAGFAALLAGDKAGLQRNFRLQAQGNRTDWQLNMTPVEAGLKQHVQLITLHGRGEALHCIQTRANSGEVQRTLLAAAARALPVDAGEAEVARLCRSGG